MKSTTERGYGNHHQKLRKRWTPIVAQGATLCARCGDLIDPDEPWDLGHTDDRSEYQGPEHRSCNRAAGGANGAATVHGRRQMTVRTWA